MISWLHYSFKTSVPQANSDDARQAQPDDVLKKVERRLRFNFSVRNAIGNEENIKVINVLQPIPGFGKGHATSNVPSHLLRFGDHVNSGRGYEILDRSTLDADHTNFLDLSDLSISGPMFVDTVHYTSEFNREIATRLKDFILDSR